MANIKVSEMTEATTFDDGDYTMIVQANQNKKISKENMLGDIEGDISTINTNIGDLSNLATDDKTSVVNSINELKNRNEWNLLTSVTGTTSVDLPSDFNELLLIVTVAGVASRKISIYVPKEAISAGIGFRGGYYSESKYTGAVYINFSTTSKVNLEEAKHNSTSVTSTSTLEVYYR